jgi:hypothetical protein
LPAVFWRPPVGCQSLLAAYGGSITPRRRDIKSARTARRFRLARVTNDWPGRRLSVPCGRRADGAGQGREGPPCGVQTGSADVTGEAGRFDSRECKRCPLGQRRRTSQGVDCCRVSLDVA